MNIKPGYGGQESFPQAGNNIVKTGFPFALPCIDRKGDVWYN